MRTIGRKISDKFENFLAAICRSSVLKVSIPLGPMLTKTKNIRKKKIKIKSQRMAQGKQQPKFERNLYIRNRDNCDTDGRWMDGRQTNFDSMSSANIVKLLKQSLKKRRGGILSLTKCLPPKYECVALLTDVKRCQGSCPNVTTKHVLFGKCNSYRLSVYRTDTMPKLRLNWLISRPLDRI